jgi:hypothetical protein
MATSEQILSVYILEISAFIRSVDKQNFCDLLRYEERKGVEGRGKKEGVRRERDNGVLDLDSFLRDDSYMLKIFVKYHKNFKNLVENTGHKKSEISAVWYFLSKQKCAEEMRKKKPHQDTIMAALSFFWCCTDTDSFTCK